MSITSKAEICNMTMSHLGNKSIISDIDTPTTKHEIIFALWYDVCRENLLKLVMPNFSISRATAAKLATTPAFGWAYEYEKPNNCLKLFGIGNVEDKANDYAVEGNKILSDTLYSSGINIRIIKNITDVTLMSSEFKILLSWFLADHVSLAITQDKQKAKMIKEVLPEKMSSLSGMNAQENMPIRISKSKFHASKYSDNPRFVTKK